MQLTGRTFYQSRNKELKDGEMSEIQEVIQSFKINESPKPSMKMKWRLSPY